MQKLLVATQNQGKVAEFSEMLSDLDVTWLSLADAGIAMHVPETGVTFKENAIIKVKAYAQAGGMMTLAEDSGLEVDALEGAPGVYTARYGGEGLSHEERYQYLLKNMLEVPEEARTARFRAVIVVANAQGEVLTTAEGVCPGRIAFEPRGDHGFGYDPVFVPDGEGGRTMAEIESARKHIVSHRGRALAKLAPELRQLLGE